MIVALEFYPTKITILCALLNFLLARFNVRTVIGASAGFLRTLVVTLLCLFLNLWIISIILDHTNYSWSQLFASQSHIVMTLLCFSWMIAIETSVLLVWEMMIPTRSFVRFPLHIIDLPNKMRIAKRACILFGIAWSKSILPYIFNRSRRGACDHHLLALYLRRFLESAGLIGIKLGQFLSTRPDLLRPEYSHELAKLQTQVPPEPWENVKAKLQKNWSPTIQKQVATINHDPIASASVAQVHIGHLIQGIPIAIKIQRSGLKTILRTDGDIMLRVSSWLSHRTKWAQKMDLHAFVWGFIRNLNEEIDQSIELNNLRSVKEEVKGLHLAKIIIPDIFPALCSQEVLTMQAIMGKPLNEGQKELSALLPHYRQHMVQELVDVNLHLIFVAGIFHADLHAGNILITEDKKLALLDFGMVGRLDRPTRDQLLLFILSVERQDSYSATRSLIKLLGESPNLSNEQLQSQISSLIMKYSHGMEAFDGRSVFVDLMDLLVNSGFRIPSDLSYAFRSIATLEGTLGLIYPEADLYTLIKNRAKYVMREKLSPHELRAELLFHGASLIPILQRLPEKIDKITSNLEQGKIGVNFHLFNNRLDRKFINRQVQQIGLILVGIASLITGVLLIKTPGGPTLTHSVSMYTCLGYTALLLGFILNTQAVILAFQINVKNRLPARKAKYPSL